MVPRNTAFEICDGLDGAFEPARELIRLAQPRDLRGAVALWNACGLVMAGHDPTEDFNVSLRESGTLVLVAVNQPTT
jgi:hypothetical protein